MSEIEPLLDLVPEALDARDEWLATASRCCDQAMIAAARENWVELERQRVAILDALEAHTERRIAMRLAGRRPDAQAVPYAAT
jgi:hypothetical protein